MKNKINLLDYEANVYNVLGPGNRFVIWTQGCPFNCKNCTTPEGIPIVTNKLIDIDTIVSLILNQKNINGITISGGEPFLQASKISKLVKKVKQHFPSINIIVYSGFTYKQLNWIEAKKLLELVDLLIDGQFAQKLHENMGIRGSKNQKFIYLTDALLPYKEQIENSTRNYKYIINANSNSIIGIPQI